MNRNFFIGTAVVLTLLDVALHFRRALIPDGNPFGTPLHQQFVLYCVVAIVLVVALLSPPGWLGGRAWLPAAALLVWELGAIGVWLIVYHAPNPPGLVPNEGYVSKAIEFLIVLALLPKVAYAAKRLS